MWSDIKYISIESDEVSAIVRLGLVYSAPHEHGDSTTKFCESSPEALFVQEGAKIRQPWVAK
jgi:hypothetical protein